MEARGRVEGSHNEHNTTLYALSTCGWCRKTRRFLESRKVAFDYIYVDLLAGDERTEVLAQVRQWNPGASFPTIVVANRLSIVGFRKDELMEALEL